jgi:hypothetical protein
MKLVKGSKIEKINNGKVVKTSIITKVTKNFCFDSFETKFKIETTKEGVLQIVDEAVSSVSYYQVSTK